VITKSWRGTGLAGTALASCLFASCLLGACHPIAGTAPGALIPTPVPEPAVYGRPGSPFTVSFLGRPRLSGRHPDGLQGVPGVAWTESWRYSAVRHHVRQWETVTVWRTRRRLSPSQAAAYLRSSLPTGRRIIVANRPARSDLRPCDTHTRCRGYTGTLEVVGPFTIYSVSIRGVNRTAASDVLHSFTIGAQ
jgi:hypothetical protein